MLKGTERYLPIPTQEPMRVKQQKYAIHSKNTTSSAGTICPAHKESLRLLNPGWRK